VLLLTLGSTCIPVSQVLPASDTSIAQKDPFLDAFIKNYELLVRSSQPGAAPSQGSHLHKRTLGMIAAMMAMKSMMSGATASAAPSGGAMAVMMKNLMAMASA
jgi:hypothetical protein